MKIENTIPDVRFKINCSGSWANLVHAKANHYEAVKAACETLAGAGHGSIRFKALDADGDVIEEYGPAQNGIGYSWHKPSRRV